jgi:ribosomal protein S18 acetylase RimI-like enzyme
MNADSRPKVTVRPARPTDMPLAVSLLSLSMDDSSKHIFEDQHRSLDSLLAALFVHPGGRFSYRFASLAELDRRSVGLLLAYPGRLITRLDLATGRLLLPLVGPLGLARLAWRSRSMRHIHEAEADEYYISNLAVLPPFQGQKVGTRLLKQAAKAARSAGLLKCSLLVSTDNHRAHQLYRRKGFRVVQILTLSRPGYHEGRRSYYRMVKSLK